jgi:dTDP-3-amino-3,4,6-trideoxy-alpha-D-glucose transaminase
VIPVVDLTRRLARFEPTYLEAVARVMRSGSLLLGPELAAFESEAAEQFDEIDFVGVSSGAAAIQLILEGLGIGPGDEVIVPAFTAVPTISAVCAAGAVPVPVDVDLRTALVDPERVAEAITGRTAAIIPVHLYGHPVDVDGLRVLRPDASSGADIAIIEDAAQAHGAAAHRGGSAATAYSFYPTKNVGGIGDGGAVGTADAELAAAIRRRRTHGMTEQYVHVDVSQNFRMSELEAAWLRLQLVDFRASTERRRTIARHYRDSAPHLAWQSDHPDHVFHLCVARFSDRDRARGELAAAGVGTAVHYPLAITQQPAYLDLSRRDCPRAERWAAECVSVPCFPELTDAEVEAVGHALASVAP